MDTDSIRDDEEKTSAKQPKLSDARRFLEVIDRNAEIFTFQTATDAEVKDKPNPDPQAEIWHRPRNRLRALADRNVEERCAVWVMINEGDGKGRSKANVVRIRAVFADCDGQVTLDELKAHDPAPHVVVESSPGKYHAYWLVVGLPLEQFDGVQRCIAKKFNTDPVVDSCRVMRVPGFLHKKDPNKPFRARIVHEHEDLVPFTANDILGTFPPAERAKPEANDSGDWPELPEPLSEQALARYRRDFPEVFEHEHPSPSERDLALIGWAHRQGWSERKAAALIRGVRQVEGDRKGERENYVWPSVWKIYRAQSEALKLVPIADWCATFTPPQYEIKGLLQRGYLYTVTGATGHGKTAVFLRIAVHKALGERLGGRRVRKGNVVYLAGENPDDVKYRCILMADWLGLDLTKLPLYFVEGTFDFNECYDKLRKQVAKIGGVSTLIVDTGPAFQAAWGFDNDNDNMQALGFALKMREFTKLPGTPAVLDLTHPVKYATRENLLPRGGGARLNHVDGNFTLWTEGDRAITELWWAGKFRGPTFEPLTFQLVKATCDTLADTEGNSIPSVYANYIDPKQTEAVVQKRSADDDAVLIAMLRTPGGSLSDLATNLEWFFKNGNPAKSRVQRAVDRLRERKLVHREGGVWILTKAGKTEAGKMDAGS